MSAKFKIGDTVVLKSSGPNMTVTKVFDGKSIWCTWFAGKKCEKSPFSEDALELVPSSKS